MRRGLRGLFLGLTLVLGGLLWSGTAATRWWIDYSQEPAPSDIIVVLSGGWSRSLYAAELFQQGLAKEVWLSRPAVPPGDERVRALGVQFPLEEELHREILVKKGIPPSRIRLYGREVLSTVHEARSLAKEFSPAGKRLLVVTSRFHARRAGMIFRRELPGAEIRMVGTPYDVPPGPWWRNKFMASAVVLELIKTAFYLVGGRFVTNGA